jgi:recombinational DNA repair protein (RecF pathway)
MAYHRYQTTGLVLGRLPNGEANYLYKILTPELGLIRVLGQGVRLEKSRMRYHLPLYSLTNFGLVKGREYWRLAGALNAEKVNTFQRQLFSRLSLIVLRLVGEGEPDQRLFDDFSQAYLILLDKNNFSEEEVSLLETFLLVRLLFRLGYLASDPLVSQVIAPTNLSWLEILSFNQEKRHLVQLINQAFLASGL